MISERTASSCHRSLDTRVKGPSSGAFQSPDAENPPGDISAAEDPSVECGEGSVASFQTWQSPEFPEHGLQKRSLEGRRGFDIFPRRVGPGTWYPHHPPVLVVIELELHQNSKAMEPGTKGNNTSSRYTNFQWRFA